MNHLIDAIESSIEQENWNAALAVSLMMPDICGKLAFPASKSRYADWFTKYVGGRYQTNWDAERMACFEKAKEAGDISEDEYARLTSGTKFSGSDCYALRCAYLHGGDGNLEAHKAKEIVDRVSFHLPDKRLGLHGSLKSGNHLVLQVDIFCDEIKEGVVAWSKVFGAEKPDAYKKMLEVQSVFTLLR